MSRRMEVELLQDRRVHLAGFTDLEDSAVGAVTLKIELALLRLLARLSFSLSSGRRLPGPINEVVRVSNLKFHGRAFSTHLIPRVQRTPYDRCCAVKQPRQLHRVLNTR
jgi:hypothetical protein